ncbi:M81 family metallopeptidase [soil metagenome]
MTLRIAYGRLFHEANAYSPLQTEIEEFERFHYLSGGALEEASSLSGTELASFMKHAELTGFRQAVRLADVDAIPLESAFAVPSGPVSRACCDELERRMLARIEAALPLDGIYLALHGSMQVAELPEAPEASLLRKVRALVGPKVKLAVSYDLHANLSAGLVEPVDVLIAFRTNPHWDLAPTGFRAGRRLLRAIRGEIRPVHAWRKLPLVLGGGTTIDFLSPMRAVFRALRAAENDPRVISASLFMVHPYTNAERLGWAVHVSTDGDAALANAVLDRLCERALEAGKVDLPEMHGVGRAITIARRSFFRKLGPVTFVYVYDIVGAGAPGGNTHLVRALLDEGSDLEAYVPVHDPALVAKLWDAPIGSRHAVILRGTPGYAMPEVALDVVVAARAEGELGRVVRLDSGKLHVAITATPPLPIHPRFWTEIGLSARKADVIVQKNFFHYRMFYATTSFQHLPVVSAGATSLDAVRARLAASPHSFGPSL